jgi:hypothetical protein
MLIKDVERIATWIGVALLGFAALFGLLRLFY